MKKIGIIGIRPSPKCKKGMGWKDYILCARPLHDALRSIGIDPQNVTYANLVDYPCKNHSLPSISEVTLRKKTIKRKMRDCDVILALGKYTYKTIKTWFKDVRYVVHPAARGKIRKREIYINHVKDILNDL